MRVRKKCGQSLKMETRKNGVSKSSHSEGLIKKRLFTDPRNAGFVWMRGWFGEKCVRLGQGSASCGRGLSLTPKDMVLIQFGSVSSETQEKCVAKCLFCSSLVLKASDLSLMVLEIWFPWGPHLHCGGEPA